MIDDGACWLGPFAHGTTAYISLSLVTLLQERTSKVFGKGRSTLDRERSAHAHEITVPPGTV